MVNPNLICSGITAQCETGGRQRCEADDDGENTSSSSQEFEDVGLREEKAFSDSEVKVSPTEHFIFNPFPTHINEKNKFAEKNHCFKFTF